MAARSAAGLAIQTAQAMHEKQKTAEAALHRIQAARQVRSPSSVTPKPCFSMCTRTPLFQGCLSGIFRAIFRICRGKDGSGVGWWLGLAWVGRRVSLGLEHCHSHQKGQDQNLRSCGIVVASLQTRAEEEAAEAQSIHAWPPAGNFAERDAPPAEPPESAAGELLIHPDLAAVGDYWGQTVSSWLGWGYRPK